MRPSLPIWWRRLPAPLVAATLAAILPAHAARAQSWLPVGPAGGTVRSLARDPADPRRLYLGTADGMLYRSDDGGARWQRLSPGFPLRRRSLDGIVVGARGAVFVGFWEIEGQGGGVARSNDGGRTFTLLKGMEGESVRALAAAPPNPAVLAAGTRSGVFLSKDGGRTWRRITPKGDADLRNIESLAFDPIDSKTLYAGTWHLAWKTRDGGVTWLPVHHGMIDDSDVMSLTVDPRDPRTVYATACTGIYRSTRGGMEWTKLEGIPETSRRTHTFALGDDGEFLLAGTTEGLWMSENSGGAWRRVTPRELVVNALLLQPDGTILVGAEEAGILRSTDRGRTWAAANAGFSERFVSSILFDEARRRVLLAAWGDPRYGGVFSAPSARGPWAHLGDGLAGRQVATLAMLGDTLLAGTDDGVFAREPESGDWTRLSTRLADGEVHPYVIGLAAAPGALLAATRQGLLRSADGGRSWSRPLGDGEQVFAVAQSPSGGVAMAAAASGVLRSEDGGRSWRRVSSDLGGVSVHRLAFLPPEGRVLLATTSGGLFRSADQGERWERAGGGIPQCDLTGIAASQDGRTIYVSDFARGGIFRSQDGGATWRRLPTDGLASDRVWTLAVDSGGQVLVGPSAGGLHLMAPASGAEAMESHGVAAGPGRAATP